QKRHKPRTAVDQLRIAANLSPDSAKYLLALGICLAELDRKQAVDVLRKAVQHGADDADGHYNLGLALATAGHDEDAVRELQVAIDREPKHAAALRCLGVTLMHMGKLREAAETFQRALAAAPDDAEAANNLGAVQLKLRDISGAVGTLERAIQINPSLIKAHAGLAQAYERAGRSADAHRESERVASLTAEQRSRGRAMILT